MENVVEFGDAKYPRLLKEIKSPPKKLYYKGDWDSDIFENCLAVVGSRRMTTYGKQITNKLVSEIARSGITIVSGFMFGIDATAHRAALGAGGRTIAVMPCGIDVIHPAYQESLYKEILENRGLIISEFESNFPPARWTYPKRNKIVAGISKATMVVEAGEKSGSLITASLAMEYKRRLFAVPGPLTSVVSKGTLQLIKEGAEIVIGAEDVLAGYDVVSLNSSGSPSLFLKLGKLEQFIVRRLQEEPLGIDALARLVKISASQIGTILSLMQLKGLVVEEGGKYHIKLVEVRP
ncbi:MAG TPA: DNA-protecting protein DprA [Candidatus Omnitrophica bacterium]|nr:DNA-protecting protein DprA [Candidatus Omnitrophota bacterium]